MSDVYSRKLLVSRWTVQAVIVSKTIIFNTSRNNQKKLQVLMRSEKGFFQPSRSFTVYRHEILRLLKAPKPAHDQLIVELPCLMGFRSEEVATWRVEYIHFDSMDCEVLDAKKHKLYTIPLNHQVGKHVEEVLNGRSEGYVIQNESTAWKGREQPLTTTAIWYVTRKWAEFINMHPSPTDYSPIVGRRFFAAEWFYKQRLGATTLSRIMRHNNIETTLRYVAQIVFYEDLKRDYDSFQFNLMEKEVEAKA